MKKLIKSKRIKPKQTKQKSRAHWKETIEKALAKNHDEGVDHEWLEAPLIHPLDMKQSS